MRIMPIVAGAALAAVLTAHAGTAKAACLTEPQFRAVIRFVAPDLIRAAAGKCSALLPAESYLTRNGSALADRYRPGAVGAWGEVKAALATQPDLSLFTAIDEGTARGLLGPMLAQGIAKENFKVADCRIADEIAANLDPLPPENLIALLAAVARFDKGKPATKAGAKPRPPLLCPAPRR